MKEYSENKWAKIIFVGMSLPMSALAVWSILSRESAVTIVGGIGMLALFLYTLINPFVHKIILDENSITEKSLFQSNRILLQEITHLSIDGILAEIRADKRKIRIGKFNIENFNEIIGFVVSKVKDNERLLIGGDLILFQAFINECSDNKLSGKYNDYESADFTFVENAELVERRWLFRTVNLTTSKGDFKITYFGKGTGYECVFVNDELVSKKDSHLWYVPELDFNFQGMNISVNVRVYPWLTIRKFWIEVDKNIVYSE